jgi:hypothetical protein
MAVTTPSALIKNVVGRLHTPYSYVMLVRLSGMLTVFDFALTGIDDDLLAFKK